MENKFEHIDKSVVAFKRNTVRKKLIDKYNEVIHSINSNDIDTELKQLKTKVYVHYELLKIGIDSIEEFKKELEKETDEIKNRALGMLEKLILIEIVELGETGKSKTN